MIKNRVAILDVGSSKIKALIGERGVNNSFSILGVSECPYEGFFEGKFFDVKGFSNAIVASIKALEGKVKADIRQVYVGVPGAFTILENRKYKIAYGKKKKIKEKDINELYETGRIYVEKEGYEIIAHSDVYFVLDDNRKIIDPVGNVSSMLGGNLSYILCNKYFINTVKNALNGLKKDKIVFVHQGFAQGGSLLDREVRESPSLIMDVGYINTDFTIILGNGALALGSVDYGGGMMTAAFVEKYGLNIEEAETLKRSVNLGFSQTGNSVYRIETDSGIKEFPTEEVNAEAINCLNTLAELTDKFVSDNSSKVKSTIKLYMTGGGISYIRGADEYVSARLGVHIDMLKHNVPKYNKAGDAPSISLLDYALTDMAKQKAKFLFFNRGN